MAKFKIEKYSRVFYLEQVTPMIHFQAKEKGAILRASEVKPRLDKYIVKKLNEKKSENLKEDSGSKNFSLNYMMKIVVSGTQEQKKPIINTTKIINIFKPTIFYSNNQTISLKVISKCEDLLDEIGEHINEFFAITNFGLRQSKGYGSFVVKNKDGQVPNPNEYEELLHKSGKDFWKTNSNDKLGVRELLNEINLIYSLIKSGINRKEKGKKIYQKGHIFSYMHDKGIGNEKAYIKSKCSGQEPKMKTKFVRAILGLAPNYNNKVCGDVSVSSAESAEKNKVERFRSPITFKIYKGAIYILAEKIPGEMYNSKFNFKIRKNESLKKNYEIQTPHKEDFNLVDFLNDFAKHFNNEKTHKNKFNSIFKCEKHYENS